MADMQIYNFFQYFSYYLYFWLSYVLKITKMFQIIYLVVLGKNNWYLKESKWNWVKTMTQAGTEAKDTRVTYMYLFYTDMLSHPSHL